MTGIVNVTGARSGVIGTITGATGSTSASDLDSGTLAAARLPVGCIIQIVQGADDTEATTSDGTWVTSVGKTITTSNSTNKILAIGTARGELDRSSDLSQGGIRMESSSSGTDQIIYYYPGSNSDAIALGTSPPYGLGGYARWTFAYTMTYVFEPDYTGAVTITMKGRSFNANTTMTMNKAGTSPNNTHSQLLLMEVVAT